MIFRPSLLLLCASPAGAFPAAVSAQAEAPADLSQVRRLSPEEKERILANSSEAIADASLMAIMGGGESRPDRVRGEVGAEVGTHGALGVFGTALVPLGDNGAAVISFSRSRLGDAGRPRR